MRKLIDLNCCTTNGWLEMEYGRLLLRLGKDEEVFAVFGPMALSENPQTAIPARAVLLEGHTRVNAFERGRAVEDLESVWSHMFVSSACNRLKELGTASGEPFARAPHPYPDTDIGCSMDCLAVYGRFGHQLSEYLGVRLLCEKYRVPLETPDWVGHYVFELSDPLPAVRRKQVKKNITQIRLDADATGGQSLCGRDFFAPGGQVEWNHATVERTRQIFKIRDFLKPCLDRFLERIKQRGRHVVCFHIRLGDRAATLQENHSATLYLHWLRANWKLLNDAVLYIASDNAEVACAWFEEFGPVQVKSFECELSGLEWLCDFYVLMMAQVVAVSQSGFSIMASVLNAQEGAILLQPDSRAGSLSPFHPARMNLAHFSPGSTELL
jgi:hypothetical protein